MRALLRRTGLRSGFNAAVVSAVTLAVIPLGLLARDAAVLAVTAVAVALEGIGHGRDPVMGGMAGGLAGGTAGALLVMAWHWWQGPPGANAEMFTVMTGMAGLLGGALGAWPYLR